MLNIVFNKSSIVLTRDMEDLLNRGLNFSILPNKLDLTQVLVDFKYFERTMIWKEFWFGREDGNKIKQRIFRVKKRNLPKRYKTPNQLKNFLGAVKSELTDCKNRNPAKCNLPPKQIQALKELIKLQRERKIVIKRCDKGAGVIILDFDDYMDASLKHLNSTHKLENGNEVSFYSEVQPEMIEEVKEKVINILQEALDNEIISKDEHDAMNPTVLESFI